MHEQFCKELVFEREGDAISSTLLFKYRTHKLMKTQKIASFEEPLRTVKMQEVLPYNIDFLLFNEYKELRV